MTPRMIIVARRMIVLADGVIAYLRNPVGYFRHRFADSPRRLLDWWSTDRVRDVVWSSHRRFVLSMTGRCIIDSRVCFVCLYICFVFTRDRVVRSLQRVRISSIAVDTKCGVFVATSDRTRNHPAQPSDERQRITRLTSRSQNTKLKPS